MSEQTGLPEGRPDIARRYSTETIVSRPRPILEERDPIREEASAAYEAASRIRARILVNVDRLREPPENS